MEKGERGGCEYYFD